MERLVRTRLVAGIFFAAGLVLIAVGLIHLAVTASVYHWFAPTITRGLAIVGPAMLLNHVVAGLLFVPLGLTTMIASRGLLGNDRKYWIVLLINTAVVCVLPILLVTIMHGPNYTALPFRVAEVLVSLAAVVMVLALAFSVRQST